MLNTFKRLIALSREQLRAECSFGLTGVRVTMLVILALSIGTVSTVSAAQFYVSTTGRAIGDGSSTDPWDLQTALSQPAVVHPGDTIWLRGGTYRGNFSSKLVGTTAAPIYVRQFPGERVILDGTASNIMALKIENATNTWFCGFEITSSASATKRISSQSGPFPTDLPFSAGVETLASTGVKLVNLIIHDTQVGMSLWSSAQNVEVRGCLIYYNGWKGSDTVHGHGIYTQNQQPSTKKIFDSIVLNNSSHGMQVYGSEVAYIDNYDIEGNAWANNGYLFTAANGRNLLVGGGRIAQNPIIKDNYLYRGPAQADSADFYLGFQTGSSNAILSNNYIVGNSTIDGTITNLRMLNNTYYGNVYGINKASYPNNTYTLTRPTGVRVYVRPNPYETGRANVVIYNWDRLNSVNVDISNIGLNVGEQYELRNAADFFNDVVVGTYDGSPIPVPMNGHSVAVPFGVAAPATTFPEFGAFVILKKGATSNNTPPTISRIAGQTIVPNTATPPLNFTVGDGQTASADLVVTASSSNQGLVPDANIQLDGTGASRTVTVTPLTDQLGTTTITLTVSDGQSTTQTSFVLIVDRVTLTTGLIGFWSFDTADISGSTLLDRSGKGGNAVGYNTTPAAGEVHEALHFNGTSSYAPVAADSNLVLTGDRTISLWIRTTDTGRYQGIISRYDASGLESGYLLRTTATGVMDLRIGGNNMSPTAGKDAIDTRQINDGAWHHVALTIKMGTGVTFYIDGVRTTFTALNIQPGSGGGGFQFGRNSFLELGRYFNGDLDQVRMYSRLLSDGEVATLYQEGAGGDSISPTVTVTTPTTNQVLIGTVTVSATAGDNLGVAAVLFQLDGVSLGSEVTATPYSFSWNTTQVPNGPHNLTAVARDAAGNQTVSAIIPITVNNPINLSTGLIGFWSFDVADVNGNTLLDRSGNGSDATGYNTTPASGKVGQGLRFNGANSFAPVPADSNLRLTGDRTLSLWIRTSSTGRYEGIISRYDAGGSESGYLLRTTPSGTLDLRIGGNNLPYPSGGRDALDTTVINDGVWHHAVVVIRMGVGVQFYVDGVRTTSTTLNVQPGTGGVTFQFGDNPFLEYGNFFNGDLDQVRVYNRVLSDADVTALYQEAGASDNFAPTVALSAPGNSQSVTGIVAVTAGATDNAGVAGVQFTLDGVNLGVEDTVAPYSVLWNTFQSTNGLHTLTAIARDTSGNIATSLLVTVTVANDLTPPTVTLAAPGNGDGVSGPVPVSAIASDNVAVAGVQFQLDGVNLGAQVTTAPYSIVWDSTQTINGLHTLTAIARDTAGNQATSAVVTVTATNDQTPPSVVISSPANGDAVFSTITISATASDNVAVVGVQFKIDGTNLGAEDTAAPYTISWNTALGSNGSHSVTAMARDASGNQTLSPAVVVTVTNDVTPPSVSMVTPSAAQTVGGTIAVTAAAGDNVGVVGVQFKLDGLNLGTEVTASPYTISWDTSQSVNGSHSLSAVARDAAGNQSNAVAVVVNVSNDPIAPTVSITAPTNSQTVANSVTVSATASDNIGVVGVQFQLDGANLGAEVTTTPYSRSWNTKLNSNGSHVLTVLARDAAGNSTTSTPVAVSVSNDTVPPTVAIAAPTNSQTVASTVLVSATANDDVAVAGVQFKLDGSNLGIEVTSPPFSVSWDTTQGANGSHTLAAIARDGAGNQATSSVINVSVNNSSSLTNGLIAYWSFDVNDVSGILLRDRSGNGSDAMGYNTTLIDGEVGNARRFNGANSFAPVNSDANLRLSGDRTFSMWLRTVNNSRTEGLLCRYDASGAESGYILRTSPTGMMEVRLGGNNTTVGSINTPDTQPINDGLWHHVVVMIKMNTGLTFYVDGIRTSSKSLDVRPGVGGSTFQMGVNAWTGYGNYFTGDLDQVRVYNRIITDGEVAALFQEAAGGDNTAPTVAVTAPTNNQTVLGLFNVTANAADNVGVAGVQFRLDGANLGSEATASPYGVAWDTRQVTNGVHTLCALARDASGNQGTSAVVVVNVDNDLVPPTVAITAPTNNQTVSGTVPLSANVADNRVLAGVQFRIDGVNLGTEVTTPPYSIFWNTTQNASGLRALTAVARDAAGNLATSTPVNVTIANSVILTNGLLAFWSFDSGDVNGNTFLDRSGNGSDAVGYNTTSVAGRVGQARRFNGANSWAPVNSDANLRLTGDRTFALWVRTTNNSRTEGLLCRYDASGAESGYIVRTSPTGMLEVRIGGNNTTVGSRNISDTQPINDGAWHHVAAVLKLGSGVTFYVDGARTSTTALDIQPGLGGSMLQLGVNPWTGYGNYFTGDMDQVRVYGRALADSDVLTLYQEGGGSSPVQLSARLSSGGTVDTDGDGVSDQQEVLAGTDPADPNSRLRMISVAASSSAVTLTWVSVPNQTYQVMYSAAPGGPWQTDLPHSRLTAGANQTVMSFTDNTIAALAGRYYKTALVSADVTTEPVGMYRATLQAGDNPVSVPLPRLADYRGVVASVVSSNTVAFSSKAGFVSGQFEPSNGISQYILLVSRDATAKPGIAGDWWPITGNTANQITVDNGPDNLTSLLASGSQIEIRHLVSLKDLFGTALASSDQIWLGTGPGIGSPIYYQTAGTPGYYQDGVLIGDGSTITLDPDQAITVSRPAGAASVTMQWVGQVQVTPLTHYLNPGDNLVGNPFPSAARLDQSGLASSGWLPDANLQANAADDDLIQAVGPAGTGALMYYHNGAISSAGWYVDGVLSNAASLNPGSAYRFSVKVGAGMLRWRQPVPFTP